MIISCLGMQSSASTWMYNVVRDILKAADLEHAAFMGETIGDFEKADADGHRRAVIKAHRFKGGMTKLFQLLGTKMIISVRDPRDAAASLVQRFGAELNNCALTTNRSIANIYSIATLADHICFYYDDYFSESVDNVERICRYIEVPLPDSRVHAIFEKYKAESVRSFIANISDLPPEQRISESDNDVADLDTQFHKNHMTDMKTGKWSSVFSGDDMRSLDGLFRGYAQLLERRGLGGSDVSSNSIDEGELLMEFDSRLFCAIDKMEGYTRRISPAESIGNLGYKLLQYIFLPVGNFVFDFHVEVGEKPIRIVACQDGKIIGTSKGSKTLSFEFKNLLTTQPFDFHIDTENMANNIEAPPTARLYARRIP